jgi:hypothetical protein
VAFATDLPPIFVIECYFCRIITVRAAYTLSYQLSVLLMAHHLPFVPLNKDSVASVFGVSTRTIENWVEQGLMPAPSVIGARVFWHPDLFYEWLDQRLRIPREEANDVKSTLSVALCKDAISGKNQLRAQTARRLANIEADL